MAIFGLSAIGAVSAPVAQAATIGSITNTPQWSLGGGSNLDINCAAGSVLRGIYSGWSTTPALTGLRSYCDPLNANGNGTTNNPVASTVQGGATGTGDNKDQYLIDCGQNFVLVGVGAASNVSYSSYATPICASLPLGNKTFTPASSSNTQANQYLGAFPSGNNPTRQTIQCSSGTVAVGLHLRTGSIADAIGLNCAPISGSNILTTATASGPNASQCSQAGTNLGYGSGDISVTGDSRGYCIIQFLNPAISFSWTVPTGVTSIDLFAVGGGGGGGPDGGGGGGGGEVRTRTGLTVSSGSAITVATGEAGAGGCWSSVGCTYDGGAGGSSTVTYSGSAALNALGGARAGGWSASDVKGAGGTGGSGGSGVNGGDGGRNPAQSGGNIGAAGASGPSSTFISGSNISYGGGGGGGGCFSVATGNKTGAVGGAGGGGTGVGYNTTTGSPAGGYGATNLGGGGGGGSACDGGNTTSVIINANGVNQRTAGGNGGSGLVAIRYAIATSVTATGVNASACTQTGSMLGNGSSTDITVVGIATGYCVVTFKNPSISYSWTAPTGVRTANILIVGGGGSGGNRGGGGGNAGGVYYGSISLTEQQIVSASVGSGGVGLTTSASNNSDGNAGTASSFASNSASGGKGGMGGGNTSTNAYMSGAGSISGTAYSGYQQGNGTYSGSGVAGGGGAGSQSAGGAAASATAAGNGGSGYSSSISGTSTCYAGGGGGAYGQVTGSAGTGGTCSGVSSGAGAGSNNQGTSGVAGSTNTGSGGGGGSFLNSANGASGVGGSGVVIVSYPMPAPTITSITPTTGAPAGSTSITMTGTNLTGATAVTVGGTAATGIVVSSPTSLTFITPSGTVGAKDVVITTPGGSATLAGSFTYAAQSVSATGTNASLCNQTGANLGNGTTTDITAVGLATGYCVITFKNSSVAYSWTVPTGVTSANVLVVGGGGAGGSRAGGGGGAGGYIAGTQTLTPGNALRLSVGAGATGQDRSVHAANGGNSSILGIAAGDLIAIGGGGGGGASATGISRRGSDGGSGGGSTATETGAANTGTAGTAGQGNGGGDAVASTSYSNWPAGGGGGAGGVGAAPANNANGGNGGTGTANSISGTSVCYATGGGGGIYTGNTGGAAGSCTSFAASVNGGSGSSGNTTPATPTANTGAGGGGAGWSGGADVNGGSGASGVVIVSYLLANLPVVSALSATTGYAAGGRSITITGTNLSSATSVKFGTTAGTITANTATSITVTVPAGTVGAVDVTVTSANGVSATSSADIFTYVATPTITTVAPTSGTTNGGTSITITGTGFDSSMTVTVGGNTCASPVITGTTQIVCTTAAGTAGAVNVVVTSTTNGGSVTSTGAYTYLNTALSALAISAGDLNPVFSQSTLSYNTWVLPTVTSLTVTPTAAGAGATITVNGTAVTSGQASTAITLSSSTTITIVVTSGSLSTTYTLTVARGSSNTFAYTGASQTWTVPTGVTQIWTVVAGASGGGGALGGKGQAVFASVDVAAGQVLRLSVGQAGSTSTTVVPFGGGGAAGTNSANSASGGGASDIRINGTGLGNRTIVGGGGGGNTYSGTGGDGGNGVNLAGTSGNTTTGTYGVTGGAGGTASAGGAGGTGSSFYGGLSGGSGSSGTGGAGGIDAAGGSGGGGGYWGGGGSGTSVTPAGGGGGSSYVGAGATYISASLGNASANGYISIYTVNPGPTVTRISPSAGPLAAGTVVTITGTNFTSNSTVAFGSFPGTSVTFVDSTTVTAATPLGTDGAAWDVRVTTSTGSSASPSAAQFTYYAAPTITGLVPTAGPLAGGTRVSMTGTKFTSTPEVTVGGVAATFISSTGTTVVFETPAKIAGAYDVVVTTPGGSATKTAGFTYVAAPTITSLDSTTGPTGGGGKVTITGTNFTGITSITVGGTTVTVGTTTATTAEIAIMPNKAAGSYDIAVTTKGGTATLTNGYTYVAAPVITSLDVTSGPIAGGTTVTITGTNFTGATGVKIGTTAATLGTVTSTTITITTPAGTAGAKNVVVTTPGGNSTSVTFTYVGAPTVTAVSPTAGPLIGGTTITLTGTNLTGATSVTFGGVAGLNISVISATSLTVVLPVSTAGQVDVVVTTPFGTSTTSASTKFTYLAAPTIASASITGTAKVGSTLTAVAGSITGTSPVTTYQWRSSATSGGTYTDIASATASTYTPVSGDAGTFIKVVITVTDNGGAASQTSAATSTVLLAAPTLASATITGTAQVGSTLTAVAGTVTGTLPVTTYQWRSSATSGGTYTDIASATASTYTLVSGDASKFIKVIITVTNNGGSAIQTSAATTTVLLAAPTLASATITGTAQVGSTLTAVAGSITGTSVTTSYQWQSATTTSGVYSNIASATASTYTPVSGDAGYFIKVVITVTNNGGSASQTSAATTAVLLTAPTLASATITGTAQVGATLTAVAGTITGTSTSTGYQWQSATTLGGVYSNIASATTSTYTPVSGDAGNFIKVIITVTNNGGSAPQTSAATTAVLLGAPTLASATITGTAQVGSTLTAVAGTITGASTSTAYQWQSATTSNGVYSNIASATSSTYTPVSGDAGTFIKVVITVSNNGGSAPQTSVATTAVLLGAPTLASATITGTAQVGATLTAVAGATTGSSTTTGYQWQSATTAGGVYSDIASATASTYTLLPTDVGNFIKVIITVTNNGGSASQTSVATTTVLLAAPTLATATITGTTQMGSTLTAVPGSITGTSPVTTYQWRSATTSGGTYSDIALATSSTYTLLPADVGNFIKVVVTVTNNGGSASRTSAATTAITAASALNPSFSSITQTADGFTITITNYSSSYNWPAPTSTAGTVTPGTPSGSNQVLTITGLNPGASATITQTTTRSGYTSGTANATGIALTGAALTPQFGTPTATADGFTVSITNYNASYNWLTPTVSVGNVSAGTPSGSTQLLTVTGVAALTSATITQVVSRTGYSSGSGTVSGTSLIGTALTPAFGPVTQTATGFTVSITNYSSSYTWLAPSVSAGSVSVGTPVGSNQLLTVTGLNPGSSATISVSNSRSGYTSGSATVSGSSLLSTDAKLSALTISSGTLSPAFNSTVSAYAVTVSNGTASVTITPTVSQTNATVQAKVGTGTYSLLTSATASGALSLAIGANTITIQVTAQDGSTTGTYVLTVTRSASTDATLSGLTISAGSFATSFSSATNAYAVAEANSVTAVTVTPTANQAYATIQVKVGTGSFSFVNSGTASGSLSLAVGANTITILVTAQDGVTSNTYSVVATRAPPSHSITYSLGLGSGTLPTQIAVTEGLTFQVAASTGLTYPGYTFNKWNDGTTDYAAGSNYTMSTANVTLTATWTATLQTVTYLAGTGGSGTAPTQANVATTSSFNTATNTFTRTGYDFAGWSDGTNTYLGNVSYTMGINNVSLTATWTPQIYTVTYNSNQATGSASRTSDSYTYGTSALNFPTVGTMAITGYTFGGWSTTAAGTALTGTYTPTVSITLYALWIPNVYTVSFSMNGALGTASAPLDYTVGTSPLVLPTDTSFNKPGYNFGGWAVSTITSTVGSTYTPTASITLQALWNPIYYAVTYNLNGGSSIAPITQSSVTIGTIIAVATEAPTRSGYAFAGWSDGAATYSPRSSYAMSTHDVAFVAQWITLYTVHYVMNGASTTAPADSLQLDGTVITLAGEPIRTGYSFNGWFDQNSVRRLAETTFNVIENSTLSAQWTAVPYTVTYSLGSAPGTAPTQSGVVIGSSFNLASAPTWAGYNFTGWSNGTTVYGARSLYVVGNQAISLTAQWSAINYTVTYDVNGASSTVPGALVKNVSQIFGLPAAPTKNGWIFDTWGDGSATYAASADYTMPANNVMLTANYHAPTPTITSLTTTSGPVTGGTTTTISGTNFTLVTGVTVGGTAAVFIINSATSLSLVTPVGTSGSVDVVVTATGGVATKVGGFTYSLLTQTPLVFVTSGGTAGTAIALTTSGGSGTGALTFVTITQGCSIVDFAGAPYLNASHPAVCQVAAIKATDSTYSQASITANIPMVKIASTISLALAANATFASYNFITPVNVSTNSPGTVSFSDDGTLVTACSAVQTVGNVATCNWTPTQIKNNKVLTASFTPTNATDYESATVTFMLNVAASSLSGLNPAELSQLGTISVLSSGATTQTFTSADTTLVLSVPANSLPAGSKVHLLLNTNGTSVQNLLGSAGYLLNSIVAWNAPDGSVPIASIPIALTISNSGIKKGMVVYGYINGVSTPLGKAVQNGTVTVYMTEDPLVVVAPTVPDAPTSVTASNGQNEQSTVQWIVPANDGGKTIIDYTVRSSGGQTCTVTGATATSCNVTGLLNATSYTFTVTARNDVGTSAASSQSASITPVGPPAIITPTTGLTGTFGAAYALQITATPGGTSQIENYALGSSSGILPPGLSLNSLNGRISGTPTAAGTYSGITVSATDSNLQTVTSDSFTITINQEAVTATLSISPTTAVSTGTAYTVTITPTLTVTGSGTGARSYAASDGTATGCRVTGTTSLTLTSDTAGTCLITATQAADSNHPAVTTSPSTFTFTKAIPSTLVIISTSGQVNTALALVVAGGSGTGVNSFTTSGTGCYITGSNLTATQLGTCSVTVTNPGDTYYSAESTTATITIGQIPLSVPSGIHLSPTSGNQLTVIFTADANGTTDLFVYADGTTNTPLRTQQGVSTGYVINGLTPATTYYISLKSVGTGNYLSSAESSRVSLSTQSGAATPTVSVSPSTTAITLGQSVTFTATASDADGGGTYSYQWSFAGSAISGAGTNVLTLTPSTTSQAGDYTVTVTNFKNNTTAVGSAVGRLAISGALSILAPTTGLSGTVGTAFSVSIPAGGGATPVAYAITSGASQLSALGLTLDTSTATAKITGTPIVAGSANVVVTVTDANTQSASTASFTITIASGTQTIAFTLSPANAVSTGSAFTAFITPTLTAAGAGSGAITYAVSSGTATDCRIVSTSGIETLTAASAGTCQIVATKAADSGYQSANSAPVIFTFTQATQSPLTITSGTTGTLDSPLNLTSQGGSGTGTVSYSVAGNSCSITGTTVSAGVPTSCAVTATNSGDTYYGSISSSPVSVNFGLATLNTPVITVVTANNSTTSLTVNYTADSHSTSITVNIYTASTGGSPIKTVVNFVSGTPVSGLSAGSTYFVALVAIGSGIYGNSAESLRTSGTTLVGATAPILDLQPSATRTLLTVGQSETITVTAHSADGGLLTYQWFFGNSSIDSATALEYSFTASSTLQSGNYSVVITNSLNGTTASTTSSVVALTVSGPIQIATPSTGLSGYQGFAYSLSITANGGSAPRTFSVTTGSAGLTALGLSLNASTGVISGTATETGTVTVAITVTDAAGSSATTAPFDITMIYDPDAPTPLFSAVVQTADGFTVRVTNYDAAYVWTASLSRGSITNSIPIGASWLLTVTGLQSGQSAELTITSSAVGYQPMSSSVTGTALGVVVPPRIEPSYFEKVSSVKIALTGNTFTFTAAKVLFSFHGGPLQPAVLSGQIINLMADGKVLVSVNAIVETQTVTVDKIVNGVTYTFEQIVFERDGVGIFDSHDLSVERAMARADRTINQKQQEIFYQAIQRMIFERQMAVSQLNTRAANKEISRPDFKSAYEELQKLWDDTQSQASMSRKKVIYDLALSNAAVLREAGISVKLLAPFDPTLEPIYWPAPPVWLAS